MNHCTDMGLPAPSGALPIGATFLIKPKHQTPLAQHQTRNAHDKISKHIKLNYFIVQFYICVFHLHDFFKIFTCSNSGGNFLIPRLLKTLLSFFQAFTALQQFLQGGFNFNRFPVGASQKKKKTIPYLKWDTQVATFFPTKSRHKGPPCWSVLGCTRAWVVAPPWPIAAARWQNAPNPHGLRRFFWLGDDIPSFSFFIL